MLNWAYSVQAMYLSEERAAPAHFGRSCLGVRDRATFGRAAHRTEGPLTG